MLPHPSPGSGLVANSPLNSMHVSSPASLMPTSSPGPCSNVQVGHSPAGSFMQTGAYTYVYHFIIMLTYSITITQGYFSNKISISRSYRR